MRLRIKGGSVHLVGEVVVDDDVDTFDVDTTAKQIRGDQDALVEFFEGLEASNALLLLEACCCIIVSIYDGRLALD